MTLDDWSVLCKYNHRVRSVIYKKEEVPYLISANFWTILGCPPFSPPLLPNLTSLSWRLRSGTFSYIRLFVTRGLMMLNITCAPYEFTIDPCIQSILSCIPSLCPSLPHICFQGSEPAHIYMTFQSWSHLLSATIGNTSDAAILHLAKHPSLQKLHLKLRTTPITPETQRLLRHSAFSALQELAVECCRLTSLDTFFKALSIAPKMLTFTVNVDLDSMRALPVSMIHVLDACAHSVLERLHVRVIENRDDFNISINAAAFRPIYAFYNLRKLNFHSNYDVQLDDATLFQMAKAWPLLEVFMVGGRHHQSSHVTANALAVLLQHCSHLRMIFIVVDWSAVDRRDVSPDILYQGPPHNNLSYADFGSSRIHHAPGVAAFLSAIAPKLQHVTAWNDAPYGNHADKNYSAKWKDVDCLVKAFSVIREHNRRMMAYTVRAVGGGVSMDGDPEDDSGIEKELTSHL